MDTNYSLADIAAASRENGMFGGSGSLVLILLFLIIFGGGGFGCRNNGDYGQYATAASQQQILFNQQFDALGNKINSIGDGICSSTYALNNTILGEGRALQGQMAEMNLVTQRNTDALRFDMSNYASATQAAIHAEAEATRNMLQQNKIESLQAQVNQLNLQQQLCGVVRYPSALTFNAGPSPFCACSNGCGCGNI